jgi:hypothetical protein
MNHPQWKKSLSFFIIDDHLWWMDSAIHPKSSFKVNNVNPGLAATSSCKEGVFCPMFTSTLLSTPVPCSFLFQSTDTFTPQGVISKSDERALRRQESACSDVTCLFYVSGFRYEQVTRPLFLESAKRNAIVIRCKNMSDINLWLKEF